MGLFEHVGTLFMLIFLQAVLGFDNLLYISIESKRVEPSKQQYVRKVGIALAIILRIVLLFVLIKAIAALEFPLFEINWPGVIESVRDPNCVPSPGHECYGGVSGHMLIVLFGGAFLLYTAVKEILHMLSIEDEEHGKEPEMRSTNAAIFWIVIMNLIFSFDSILGAIALTDNIYVMTIAIVISGIMMMALADKVSDFLKKNRMYEILGLFILFLVGVMLVSEAGHLGHLKLLGSEVHAMPKATFYFVLIVLVVVDIAQSRYQRKLNIEKMRASGKTPDAEP